MSKILDPKFKYTESTKTNIADTFKRHGFVAPDRKRQAQMRRKLNPI